MHTHKCEFTISAARLRASPGTCRALSATACVMQVRCYPSPGHVHVSFRIRPVAWTVAESTLHTDRNATAHRAYNIPSDEWSTPYRLQADHRLCFHNQSCTQTDRQRHDQSHCSSWCACGCVKSHIGRRHASTRMRSLVLTAFQGMRSPLPCR
jgi:hypothetical protein